MKNYAFILLLFWMLIEGCENKISVGDSLKLSSRSLQIDSIALNKKRIICILDGDCCLCLAELINFNENVRHQGFQYPVFYIVTTQNVQQFEENLQILNLPMQGKILIDSLCVIKKLNTVRLQSNFNVFLVNHKNKILQYGNPFEDASIMEKYYET